MCNFLSIFVDLILFRQRVNILISWMISKDKIGKLASRWIDKHTDLAVGFRSFYYQPAYFQPVINPQLAHHFVKPPVIHSIGFSLKDTGTLYLTRTSCSSWQPGIHLGMPLTTLKASASRAISTCRNTLTSVREPSFSTIKPITTRPYTPCFLANSGYFTLSVRYFNSAASPPSKMGICSHTS